MSAPDVDTTHDDVSTSGMVEDLVDAAKRVPGYLRDKAREELEHMRDVYARRRVEQAVNLALFVGLAYLLLRGKRR